MRIVFSPDEHGVSETLFSDLYLIYDLFLFLFQCFDVIQEFFDMAYTLTSPLTKSKVTLSLFLRILVACLVPTIQGRLNSRATIAA
mgnify:CR=1 FL=1